MAQLIVLAEAHAVNNLVAELGHERKQVIDDDGLRTVLLHCTVEGGGDKSIATASMCWQSLSSHTENGHTIFP